MIKITALLLALTGGAAAQGNPGFIQGATLCADSGCSSTPPINPLGLNQAFIRKTDVGSNPAGIDPKSMGARCDGVTDDTSPVHSAALAAQDANVPLHFSGICLISAGVGFRDAPMKITGNGWNTGLLVATAGPTFRHVSAQPIIVRDMLIRYATAPPYNFGKMGIAIQIDAPNGQENFGSEISNVWIDWAQTGVQTIRASRYKFHDNFITDGVNGFDLNNINLVDSGDGAVYNNIVQGMDNASIVWQGGGATRIYGNKLLGGVYGVHINFAGGGSTVSPQISINSMEGFSGACVRATRQSPLNTLVSMLYQDNECAGANIGVWIPNDTTGSWITGLTITGGYYQGGAMTSALTIDSVDVVVIGPFVINATQTPVYPYIIGAGATRVSVGQIQCNANCVAGANSGPSTSFLPATPVEQTCALTVTFGGTAATLDAQFCSYTAVGGRVFVNFYLAISAKNGTGELDFGNLPVPASSNNANLGSIGTMQVGALGVSLPSFMSISVNPGTSTAKPYYQTPTARDNLTHINFGACAPGAECTLLGGFSYIR